SVSHRRTRPSPEVRSTVTSRSNCPSEGPTPDVAPVAYQSSAKEGFTFPMRSRSGRDCELTSHGVARRSLFHDRIAQAMGGESRDPPREIRTFTGPGPARGDAESSGSFRSYVLESGAGDPGSPDARVDHGSPEMKESRGTTGCAPCREKLAVP